MHPFGFTRSRTARNYALITPASHVEAALPRWIGASGIIVIAPGIGAGFAQFFALMEAGGTAGLPLPGVERFVYVEEGRVQCALPSRTVALEPGGYAYIPAGVPHALTAEKPCRLTLFERRYSALDGAGQPEPVTGQEQDVAAEPFMDDADALLKTLLPATPEYDMAVNLFAFNPGAALPLVEVHVMEHGLLMLQGRGIYRLDDDWHPVQAGDVIWMAPYCPQWFTAVGKQPARYLYYKDVGRDPLA